MNSNSRDIVSDGYQITDRRAYIRRLCAMLGIVGPARINRAFRERVMEIQEAADVTVTGVVDYETYRLICVENRRGKLREICLYDSGDDVIRLNADLSRLVIQYELPLRRPRGRFFGVDSMRVATRLREIYCLPVTDKADADLLRAIKRDVGSINAINQ